MKEFPKTQFDKNKRIDRLLEIAGKTDYETYIRAIKKSRQNGSTILLERDIDEIFINN